MFCAIAGVTRCAGIVLVRFTIGVRSIRGRIVWAGAGSGTPEKATKSATAGQKEDTSRVINTSTPRLIAAVQ
jgi:hypothetical protein